MGNIGLGDSLRWKNFLRVYNYHSGLNTRLLG